jgi:glycosyltransferase involved in cell wall biosynthesis
MKILIDNYIFTNQKYGGISRYYTEIFLKLKSDKNTVINLPLFQCQNLYLNESSLLSKKQYLTYYAINLLSKFGISTRKYIKKKNDKLALNALLKNDFDLFIPTYYDISFINYLENKPFVLTVYDMIHEIFPQYFENDSINVKNKLILMEKATKIIAVSQNTKNDILKIYPHINESKIEVIYHGSSIKINNKLKVSLPLNYILFVGVRDNYKNFQFLLHSISDILLNDKTLKLVCAGGGKFSDYEKKLIYNLNLTDNVIQNNFNDNELGHYYKNAKCFIFPSEYEGFGIPILESMACGCPIVLTNNSSFPEVAGNAGIYFELNNSVDLKNKIESLLQNDGLRNEYSLKGFEQVKKFDWEIASEKCFKLYQSAIKQSF